MQASREPALWRQAVRAVFRAVLRPLLRWWPRDRSRKDVLFLCQNGLMADYLAPFWACLRDDPRLRFWLTFPNEDWTRHERERVLAKLPVEEVSLRWAYVRPWDLVVTADHGHAAIATNERRPVVFTGHGITGKVIDGEEGDYMYGPRTRRRDGKPRYSAMLEASEANRDRVVRERPEYRDVIEVVGSLQNDVVLAELPRREEFRQQLGFSPDDTVVFVIGTWGPNSLYHVIGEPLIEQMRRLEGQYRFVLSIHPHEYRPQPRGRRVWGEYLRELRGEGFVVREPSESWVPHMVASDVIVTDHTSLSIYGVLAHKPMIWSPVPEEFVEKGTAIWKLRGLCHELTDPSRLEDELEWALHDFPKERLEALAREINSRPGQAEQLVRGVVYRLLELPARPAKPPPSVTPARETVATS